MAPFILPCLVAGALVFIFPEALVIVLVVHLLMIIGVETLRFVLIAMHRHSTSADDITEPQQWPFISVHVPIHAEPPHIVMQTLNALAASDYEHFEVVVLDNNTQDRALWVPVQRHCERLGNRFRFFHDDGVVGAKAGALNLGRRRADERAQIIAVVDADYQPEPEFLRLGAARMVQETLDYIQFPQAYRAVDGERDGVAAEIGEYFSLYPDIADRHGATLLAGTLLMIRRDALNAVGGWSGQTVTEDAELGARFCAAGFKGAHDPRVVGRGLLPASCESLGKQRHRWSAGNAQVLRKVLSDPSLRAKPITFLTLICQLTTWFGWLLVPVSTLAASTVFSWFADRSPAHDLVDWLCIVTIALAITMNGVRIWLSCRHAWRAAALTRFAMAWESSFAAFEVLWTRTRLFARTDKSGKSVESSPDPTMFLALLMVVLALFTVSQGGIQNYVKASLFMLLALIAPTRNWLDHVLRQPSECQPDRPL